MRRTLAFLFLAAALVAGTADARSHDGRMPAAASASISVIPALQDQVLGEINALRRSRGLGELKLSPALSVAALGHSRSMAQRGFFSHSAWNGAAFWTRIKPRYKPLPGRYWGVGENLVWASPDLSADQAIETWMNSPPHRQNLLSPQWHEIGLGAVRALGAPGVYQGLDVTILTADFGVR